MPAPLAVELDLDRRQPGREPDEEARAREVEGVAEWEEADEDEREVEVEDAEGDGLPTGQLDVEVDVPSGDALRAASPARRAAAWAIDGALVSAVAIAVPVLLLASSGAIPATDGHRWAFGSPLWLLLPAEGFVAVVAFVYATVSHALAGATLGKRIARIRVVDSDGLTPGIACSASRSAWAVASIALAGTGLLLALVSPSGRALHDLLAGTRVVEAT
ncbi:MAG: RDD family protein [Anaeromyxobacteraceae bacterium]